MEELAHVVVVLPPPSRTNQSGVIEWSTVERDVGVALPPDYKQFVETYGVGSIDNFLWVFHPTTTNPHLRLRDQIQRQLAALRALMNSGSERIPFPLFPEPGGLLPWGITDNGDVCYWLTHGSNSAAWSVAINEARGPDWCQFDGSLAAFLVSIIERRYRCAFFPPDFPREGPSFVALA